MVVECRKPATHRSAHLADWHGDPSSRWGAQRAVSQSFGGECLEGSPFSDGAVELHAAMEESAVVEVMNPTWAAALLEAWMQATP